MKPCPSCRTELSDTAETCPKCGHVIKKPQTAGGILAAIVIGILGFVLLMALIG